MKIMKTLNLKKLIVLQFLGLVLLFGIALPSQAQGTPIGDVMALYNALSPLYVTATNSCPGGQNAVTTISLATGAVYDLSQIQIAPARPSFGGTIISSRFPLGCKLVINGNGATILGQDYNIFVFTTSASALTINNLRIIGGGNTDGRGGGVIATSGGTLNLTDVEISGSQITPRSSADVYGGAISIGGGTVTITNSRFFYNRANASGTRNGYGGAIGISGAPATATITITNSVFIGNYASGSGGAIYSHNQSGLTANLIVQDSLIQHNYAGAYGGALAGGRFDVFETCFLDNRDTNNQNVYRSISSYVPKAEQNWWGEATGAGTSTTSTGNADTASSNLNVANHEPAILPQCDDYTLDSITVPRGQAQMFGNVLRLQSLFWGGDLGKTCPHSTFTIHLDTNGFYDISKIPAISLGSYGSFRLPVLCPIVVEGHGSLLQSNTSGSSSAMRGFGVINVAGTGSGSLELNDLSIVNTSSTITGGNGGLIASEGAAVSLTNVSLTGGYLQADNAYGGSISVNNGSLTISDSEILSSGIAGANSQGGAIALRGNSASGSISGSYIKTSVSSTAAAAIYTDAPLSITNSQFFNNSASGNAQTVDALLSAETVANAVSITNSCITGHPHTAIAGTSALINASNNWWGDWRGPSNNGGTGDLAGSFVNYASPKATALAHCSFPNTDAVTIPNGDTAALVAVINDWNNDCGLSPKTINLAANGIYEFSAPMGYYNSASALIVRCPLIINGNNATLRPAVGAPAMRFMTAVPAPLVFNETFLSLNGVNLSSWGNALIDGAVVYGKNVDLVVTNSHFTNNRGNDAGVFWLENTSLDITASTFNQNQANFNYGQIALYENAEVIITASEFRNNIGGVLASDGDYDAYSHLQIYSSTFANNSFSGTFNGSGAAIQASATDIEIVSSDFDANISGGSGGAIYLEDSTLSVTGTAQDPSTFTGNEGDYGGAIYFYGTSFHLNHVRALNNISDDEGGFAVLEVDEDATSFLIENSHFESNQAASNGGAFYIRDNTGGEYELNTQFMNNRFVNNSSEGSGGALYSWSRLSISGSPLTGLNTGSLFIGNHADQDGGAIAQDDGYLSIQNTRFDGNSADGNGGALQLWDVDLTLSSSNLSYNHADNGGALYIQDKFTTDGSTITDTEIIGNSALGNGGAIANVKDNQNSAPLTITDSTIVNNHAGTLNGDAIYVDSISAVTSIHTSCIYFNGNTAVYTAGAVAINATGNWWGNAAGPIGTGIINENIVSGLVTYSPFETSPLSNCTSLADSDNDFLVNVFESYLVSNPGNSDTNSNSVLDGIDVLIDGFDLDTWNLDTDGDGLLDSYEIDGRKNPFGFEPTVWNDNDSDDDGLWDGDEVFGLANNTIPSNPNAQDSDNDALWDGSTATVRGERDGSDPASLDGYGTDPLDEDSDNDGLYDGHEAVGTYNNDEPTDPTLNDSDGDGLLDGTTYLVRGERRGSVNTSLPSYGTDPNAVDSDSDGLNDNHEINGQYNNGVFTNPNNSDSDGDGLLDGSTPTVQGELDGSDPASLDGHGTNPNVADTDGDGLTDQDEISGDRNPNPNPPTNPLEVDTDGDGLWDGTAGTRRGELDQNEDNPGYGTDPNLADSDEDTLTDDIDLCPRFHSLDQTDSNGDGQGDVCEAGQISPANSTIVFSPNPAQAAADGIDRITITITLRDGEGNLLNRVPVEITTSSTFVTIAQASGQTDDNGVYQTTITGTEINSALLDIEAGPDPLAGHHIFEDYSIQFTGNDIAVEVIGLQRILAGETLIYVVEVSNIGGLAANNVNVLAAVPLGTATIEDILYETDNAQLLNQGTNAVSWLIPSLAAGSSESFIVYARSAANLQMTNLVSLEAFSDASMDSNPLNNDASARTVIDRARSPESIEQEENLSVSYTASSETAVLGETVTLEIEVLNVSDYAVYNVEGFAALKDTFANRFGAASMLSFTWPDAAYPGRLLPGESATASFDYVVTSAYPNLDALVRTVRVKAVDYDPSDGALIAVFDELTPEEFSVVGPHLLAEVIADRDYARPGETVNFTVRLMNETGFTDSISNLVVTDLLSGEEIVFDLGAGETLDPGETVSQTFSYVVQESDIPFLNAIVIIEGNGTTSLATVAESAQKSVTILGENDPDPVNFVDLVVSAPSAQTLVFPNFNFSLPILVENNGTIDASASSLILRLPLNVTVSNLAGGTYDEPTHTLSWDLGTINAAGNRFLSPTFISSAPAGEILNLQWTVSNINGDRNYANNGLSLLLPVVERVASSASLSLLSETGLVADGIDTIDIQLEVLDQLGNPFANATALMSSNAGSLVFAPNSVTTDSSGHALIQVSAIASGTDIAIADLGMGLVANLGISIAPNSLVIDPPDRTVGIGGYTRMTFNVINTGEAASSFDYNVTGLDPNWVVSYSNSPLLLGLGQSGSSHMTIAVPSTTSCSLAGNYPYTVTVLDDDGQELDTAQGTITLTATPPEVTSQLPLENAQIGSQQVLFSWRSNTTGEAHIIVRSLSNGTEYEFDLTQSADDPSYYSVLATLPKGQYVWDGSFGTEACGYRSIPGRLLSVVDGISFVQRNYEYEIFDDYNVSFDVDDQPLIVRVQNRSGSSKNVRVTLDNPYPDLIIGFTGAGSVDSYLNLSNDQIATLNLRVFTQETTQSEYTITLNLSSPDTNVTDSVPLTIRIQSPDDLTGLSLTNASLDTRNLVTEVTLSNSAETLTDLNLQVVQVVGPNEYLPADYLILPAIEHAYMPEGQSYQLEIIPLDLTDVPSTANIAILASSRAGSRIIPISSLGGGSYDLSNTCRPERPIIETCTMAGGSITFGSRGWYCTNKQNIDLTVPWTLNSQVPISSIEVGMSFSQHADSESVYSHSTELFFNNVSLGGGIVPDVSELNFAAPLSSVVLGANYQTINLRSLHTNNAHYAVATDATVRVTYGAYEREACYSSAELNDATIFPCANQGDCQADLTVSQLRVERSGENVILTVRVGNGGTVAASNPVQVSFYDGHPAAGGAILETISTLSGINPGHYEDISLSLPLADLTALPLFIVADDAGGGLGSYSESDEENNIYNTGVFFSPDLSVTAVDTRLLSVNPNSLVATGRLTAQIVSPIFVGQSFDVLFFEDTNANGVYDEGENTLATVSQSNLQANQAVLVSATVNDTLRSVNSPISVFVDSADSIIESDETNNVSSSLNCIAPLCSTALPDLTASYMRIERDSSNATLTVRIANNGGASVPAGVSVAFYSADPASGGTVLQTVNTTTALGLGQYQDVQVTLPLSSEARPAWVFVDNLNAISEISEFNNVYRSNSYVTNAVNQAPTVSLPANMQLVEGIDIQDGQFVLSAIASDIDELPSGDLIARWELVSGNPSLSFSVVYVPTTTVHLPEAGVYILRLTVSDGELSAYDEITITYLTPAQPSQVLDIDGCIASPTNAYRDAQGNGLRGIVQIVLHDDVELNNAAIYYWPAHDPQSYRALLLGVNLEGGLDHAIPFDTTMLANDSYGIQVVGYNPSGERVVCGIGAFITGEFKPGRVVLSTTDFTIPLAGIPITVGRTYDSLERNIEGDFGYGWNLALGNPRLEVDDANNVTMTLPDGTRKTFYFYAQPYPWFFFFGSPQFANSYGEYGELTATDSCPLLANSPVGWVCFDVQELDYRDNVQLYHYTDPQGRVFTYNTEGTLQSIQDLSGNVISFEDDGIHSSLSPDDEPIVPIFRDTQGRITMIKDAEGREYRYEYENGDLVRVILPDTATIDDPTIQYFYLSGQQAHFFDYGIDPRGNEVITTSYYDDGRLHQVTDAMGHTTTYTYTFREENQSCPTGPSYSSLPADVVGATCIVNRVNNVDLVSQSYFDLNGNLRIEIDELGHATVYTWNNGKMTSILNADGELSTFHYDANGNLDGSVNGENIQVFTATNNQYGRPTSVTSALGITRTITYDPLTGLPVSADDAMGNIATYDWNEETGNLEFVTLPEVVAGEENVTQFVYNDSGYLITQISPETEAGRNEMDFDYDLMGRRTLATDINGTYTETSYDSHGNILLVETWEPAEPNPILLRRVSFEYDANGNTTAMIDVNGIRTTFEYYENNRLKYSRFADGSYRYREYDWRGNVTLDRAINGVETCYIYDVAGRLTEVRQNCNVPSLTIVTSYAYDAADRRTDTYINGVHVSNVAYDNAGQVIRTTTILNPTTPDFNDDATTHYVYDRAGQIVEIRDAMGHSTYFGYDDRGQRIRTTYPDGSISYSEYDILGRLSRQTNTGGYQTSYQYDTTGNLLSQTFAANTGDAQTVRYTYDVQGQLTDITNVIEGDDNVTHYSYDDLGRVIRVDYAYGSANPVTTHTTYNLLGQQVETIDGEGTITHYWYDEMGRIEKIDYAYGLSIQVSSRMNYNVLGQLSSSVDGIGAGNPNGYTTQYDYDDAGRLIGICDARVTEACNSLMLYTSSYVYDERGRQIESLDADRTRRRMVYDNANRLTMSIANFMPHDTGAGYSNPANWSFSSGAWRDGSTPISHGVNNSVNIITQYSYDVLGRQTAIRDVQGNLTQYFYDAEGMGQLERILNADGTDILYQYDVMGRQTAVTNENDLTTNYSYDPLGRLTSVRNPAGETVSYGYDELGNINSISNGRGKVTRMEYDLLGNLSEVTWPMGENEVFEYDDNGNLVRHTLTDGNVDIFEYDELNRLTHESYDFYDAESIEYGYRYDSRGLQTQVLNGAPTNGDSDVLVSYEYDVLGRPISVVNHTGSETSSVHYGYDDIYDRDSNRSSLETRVNNERRSYQAYCYDELGRVSLVSEGEYDCEDGTGTAPTSTFNYDTVGLMRSVTRPNGVTTDFEYDPQRYFLTDIEHRVGIDPIAQFHYEYDNLGNRLSMTDVLADDTIQYRYDAANRLVRVLNEDNARIAEYSYDGAGNRIREFQVGFGTSEFVYNDNDQLERINMPDHYWQEYGYDPRGNLLYSRTMGHGSIYTEGEYEYDALDQMVKANDISYSYDYAGRRIQANNGSSVINYVWDEFSAYGDVVLETDFFNETLRSYTIAEGMLISQTTPSNPEISRTQYFLGDAQASTRALTNTTGAVSAEYNYDAFGNLSANINYDEAGEVIADSQDSFATNYLYTGQQYDPATELYSLRARYYDPSTGHLLSRDEASYNYQNPFELNRYAYVGNNPMMYTDPSGNSALIEFAKRSIVTIAKRAVIGAIGGGVSGAVGAFAIITLDALKLCGEPQMFATWEARDKFFTDTVKQGMWAGFLFGTALGFAEVLFGAIVVQAMELQDALNDLVESTTAFAQNPSACTAVYVGLSLYDIFNGTNDNINFEPNTNQNNNQNSETTTDPDDGNQGTETDPDEQQCTCSCGNSFSADTEVTTTDGDVPISEIEVGDKVLAYDEETGITGEYTVTDTINHVDETIIHLTIDGELIETTPEHPFLTDEGIWVDAEDLEIGEQILSLGGVYGTVEAVVVVEDAYQRMYNLTVDGVHTFVVGDGNWVVHNEERIRTITINNGRNIVIGSYGDLSGSPQANGAQAHHLNQDAVYSNSRRVNPIIPSDDGIAVAIYGNAFVDIDSWHYKVHQSMETFWDHYRDGGSKAGDRPTHAEIGAAMEAALIFAGFTDAEASVLGDLARSQRAQYGISEADQIGEIPGRVNQKKDC